MQRGWIEVVIVRLSLSDSLAQFTIYGQPGEPTLGPEQVVNRRAQIFTWTKGYFHLDEPKPSSGRSLNCTWPISGAQKTHVASSFPQASYFAMAKPYYLSVKSYLRCPLVC